MATAIFAIATTTTHITAATKTITFKATTIMTLQQF